MAMKRKITRQRLTILPRIWIYLFLILLFLMTIITFLLTEQKYSSSRTHPKMNMFLPHEVEEEVVDENIDENIVKQVIDNKDEAVAVEQEDNNDEKKNSGENVENGVKEVVNGSQNNNNDDAQEDRNNVVKEKEKVDIDNGVAKDDRNNIAKEVENNVKQIDVKEVKNDAKEIENDVAKDVPKNVVKEKIENKPEDVHMLPAKDILVNEEDVIIPPLIFGSNGKGHNGSAVHVNRTLLSPEDQKRFDEGYQRNAFNNYISDLISVDRLPLPTARDPLCLTLKYSDDLPDTSVIITFRNEAWSVLVRTIHSIIRTAPTHLLREIILVDDFSEYDYLKAPLEVYMRRFPKVKILRNKQREGLIRSRLFGAQIAVGQTLTFLDSHIECATDWLPPLLTRIKQNSSAVVWPVIPSIDQDTFQFVNFASAAAVPMGVFDWRMGFTWMPPDVKSRETPISPMRTPTMAGGLFSIDRDYFYHIGSYDDQMMLWGAENLEISFRIWMCGGTLEMIPCSVIAHIFRLRNVNINPKNTYALTYNSIRTAVVWMDGYQHLYSKYNDVQLSNYGDVSARVELRRNLQCKSFQWYLDNIFPQVFHPNKALKYGLIRNKGNPSLCLQARDAKDAKVTLKRCNQTMFATQVFYTTIDEELRLLLKCVDIGKGDPILFPCHRQKGNQAFQVREDGSIYSPTRNTCFQWKVLGMGVEQARCNGSARQQWTWEPVLLDFSKVYA